MNGDEVFIPSKNFNINQAYQQHVETKSLATLFVTEHEGVGTRFGGVWCDSKMRVKDFGKGPVKENLKGWHYIGHMILSHEIFKFINSSEPLNIIYDVLLKQIQQGEKVMAYNSQGLWFETGNKEDYLKAHTEGLKILAPEAQEEKSKESALGYKLWLKNHIEHFQSVPFQMHKKNAGLQWTSTASKISDSATLSGYCVIGAGAVLGDDSHVEHSVVIENAQLEPGQHITNEIWI